MGDDIPLKHFAWLLWLLMLAFVLRVIGQMLVAFGGVVWLPPMEAWMSGLMSYRYLLPSQILIIIILTKICLDFTRGRGWWVQPRRAFASAGLYFGWAYFSGMVLRYMIQMTLRPETRWLGGTIPIAFHLVLATFVIAFALWHRKRLRETKAWA